MSHDPVKQALEHHAYLWTIYGPAVDNAPLARHPIAFLARARSELEAQNIAAALRSLHYEIIEVAKKLWPLWCRWHIVARTEAIPFTRESTQQWVRSTATLLTQYNGILDHWHPAEKPAA